MDAKTHSVIHHVILLSNRAENPANHFLLFRIVYSFESKIYFLVSAECTLCDRRYSELL